ncbi:MAG: hypothetical protein ABIU07_03120, partial [Ramlibacter sp.]
KSTAAKVTELAEGFPDFVWVFSTPPGRKGEVQLVARLRWSDKTAVALKPPPGHAYIHYDPAHSQSVAFENSATDSALAATTEWMANHFQRTLAAKFISNGGQEPIRGAALNELQRLASGFDSVPFAQHVPVAG